MLAHAPRRRRGQRRFLTQRTPRSTQSSVVAILVGFVHAIVVFGLCARHNLCIEQSFLHRRGDDPILGPGLEYVKFIIRCLDARCSTIQSGFAQLFLILQRNTEDGELKRSALDAHRVALESVSLFRRV